MQLTCVNLPDSYLSFTNFVYINPKLFQSLQGEIHKYLAIKYKESLLVYIAQPSSEINENSIGMGTKQRVSTRLSLNKVGSFEIFDHTQAPKTKMLALDVKNIGEPTDVKEISFTDFVEHILSEYTGHIVLVGQVIPTMFEGVLFLVTILDSSHAENSMITRQTEIMLSVNENSKFKFTENPDTTTTSSNTLASGANIFQRGTSSSAIGNWSFEEYEIGGLDSQLNIIFRRAFSTRRFPGLAKKMGTKHVKGIMLYGPPGTGKTLIARQIGKMLKTIPPKIVSGPEILDKYVGGSQKKIRDLFSDAEAEYKLKGDQSQLHLIIFDEIDAITKQRGSTGDSTGVNDSIVNQLLAKMDGVESLDNILILGLTNRMDFIDEALLRPGRFEVKIEINLPDEIGRQQILRIHTKHIREQSMLDSLVNLDDVATKTVNYSGAELEGVVRNASTFALTRHMSSIEDQEITSSSSNPTTIKITVDDFDRALREVKPLFGPALDEQIQIQPVVGYGERYDTLWDNSCSFVKQLKQSNKTSRISLLLEGKEGSGKTSIAIKLARYTEFPFVKLLSAQPFEQATAQKINKAFDDAQKSDFSVIILDDLERLIQYVGGRFSNLVLQTLLVRIKDTFAIAQQGKKLLILATTSNENILDELGLLGCFNAAINIPYLDKREALKVMKAYNYNITQYFNYDSALGIKKLLFILEMATTFSDGETTTTITADDYEKAKVCVLK